MQRFKVEIASEKLLQTFRTPRTLENQSHRIVVLGCEEVGVVGENINQEFDGHFVELFVLEASDDGVDQIPKRANKNVTAGR